MTILEAISNIKTLDAERIPNMVFYPHNWDNHKALKLSSDLLSLELLIFEGDAVICVDRDYKLSGMEIMDTTWTVEDCISMKILYLK